ncbi:MAG: MerR family transcriptional regulator [Clostridia bacterium]|nr:MerR family transcriptional regulator [Clostridia bacterium]
MGKMKYMISDAAKEVDVEAHVLRYWEEELKLDIARNEMGHRYYTDEDIIKFREIRDLKEKGYQLKAIKMFFLNQETQEAVKSELTQQQHQVHQQQHQIVNVQDADTVHVLNGDRRQQAKEVFRELMAEIMAEHTNLIIAAMNEKVGDRVIKQVDYLFREQEEKEEARYQQIDRLIRGKQFGRKKRKNRL